MSVFEAVGARVPAPRLWATTRRGLYEALRTAFHRGAIDGGGLVVAVAFYVVIVATLSGLWRVAVNANGGDLAGYSALALTWYIITSEAAIVSVNARHIEEVGNDIAQGTVAVELLRPASVLGIRMATEVGRGLPKVAALFVSGAVLATVVSDGPPRPATLVLVAPSLVLAITANLFAQHTVAAIAFWVRDAGSIWFLYMKAVFILGGMIIPLELLPDGLQRVAMLLPFRAMAYAPARLAAGFWEPWLLVEQLFWIIVLGIGAAAAFRAGERRLQVVGG
jgi:ABC-2 type transport system permease protein